MRATGSKEKNQNLTKTNRLNSKIAGPYAKIIGLRGWCLFLIILSKMASNKLPQRALTEKEKVADFL